MKNGRMIMSTKERLRDEISNEWYDAHFRGYRLKDMDSKGRELYLKNIKK